MDHFVSACLSSLSLAAISLAVFSTVGCQASQPPAQIQPPIIATPNTATAPAAEPWMDTIRQRIVTAFMPNPANLDADAAAARKIASSLQADGSWTDVNYTDQQRAFWPGANHITRMQTMTRGYVALRAAGKPDPELLAKIQLAADFWFKTDPHCENWWWNEISVPQSLGSIMILLGPDAQTEQVARTIDIMKRSRWSTWTGQNLAWGTGIQILRGLLEQNAATVREGFDRMYAEVRVSPLNEEGIMPDFSFHQHGKQLYSGGYGRGFTVDLARFIAYSWGTPAQIPSPQLDIYLDYLLSGQQWLVYNGIFDYSVAGREFIRETKTPPARSNPLPLIDNLARLDGMPRRAEIAAFAGVLNREPGAKAAIGNRHFWCSDYMAHRISGAMVSVRMFSTRTRNTEEVNSENRKGHHVADGATYIYRTGAEYYGIFPSWDWDKVPGTTAELSEAGNDPDSVLPNGHKGVMGSTTFVGGVSDGDIGLAAMDFKRGALSAHKAWACAGNVIVCLGAGITSESPREVFTTINQCLHDNQVFSMMDTAGGTCYWHAGIGYIIPAAEQTNPQTLRAPQQVSATHAQRTGKWGDIGVSNAPPVTNDVLTIGISHGTSPRDAKYQYILLPNITRDELDKRIANPGAAIIRNDTTIQAVRIGADLLIAFWQPGQLVDGARTITADQPCLLLVRQKPSTPNGGDVFAISASNPKNAPLALTINLRTSATTHTAQFNLPDGPLAGSTATITVGK